MRKYVACVLFLMLVQVCRVSAQNITITVTDQFYTCYNGNLSFTYHVSVADGVNSPNLSTFYGTSVGFTSSGTQSSGTSEYDGYFSGQWIIGQSVSIWAEGYNNNSAPRRDYSFTPDYTNDLVKPTITTSNIPLCGSTVGTMTAEGYGGTFVWNNGGIGAVYNVNETGTYSVHLSNYCGVSPESDPVIVTNGTTPPAPTLIASPQSVLCNGGSTGLYGSPSAGGTIHWSTGESGNMITVSTPGNYYAYEVNACGQSGNSNIITITAVNTSDVPAISSINGTTLCDGASTTLTAVSAHGGTVYWNTGQTGNSITVSSAGSYLAYESNACGTSNYSNAIDITTVSTPNAPSIVTNQSTLLCDGATATLFVPSLTATVTWNTGATGSSITTGSAGSYYANQSNTCGTSGNSNTIICTIGSTPAPPDISPAGPIQLCNGSSVTLTIPGGRNTNWFLNGGLISANSGTQVVNTLGSYTATLNNACGISAQGPAVIITTGSSPVAPTITSSSTIICNGTPVGLSVSASGGGTIHWSNGQTAAAIGVTSPGVYYAYESNGCGNSGNSNSITLISGSSPTAPSLNVTGSITLCNGASQLINTSPSFGGSIHWNNGSTGNSITVNTAGSYYAYETNGCGNSGNSASVNISTLSSPVAPTVTPPGSQLLCNRQSVSFNASGSTITWSNGATGNNMVTGVAGTYYAYDRNVCGNSPNSNSVVITTGNCPTPSPGTSFFICPGALKTLDAGAGYDTYAWSNGATTRTISVGPGNYAVTVSKSGCFAASVTVSVSYYTVTTPSISASGPTTFCAGNNVTLSSSPASAYLWSNGSTSSAINVTVSGSYFVTVTDANGCQATSTATAVAVNPLPTASIGGTTAVCKNAASPSIIFNASGGTAPYTFAYNINGGSTQTITTGTSNVLVAVPTAIAGAFVYNLIGVRESSSTACFNAVSGSATVTVRDLPTASIAGSTSVCLNSASPLLTFTGSTGTAPYTFTYSINGGANQTVSTTSGNSVSITVPTGSAGTYTYSLIGVRESSGLVCANAQSGSATVVVKPLPSATIAGTTTVCQNSVAPSISFTGTGATVPYIFTYKINGGANQTVTTTSGNSVIVSVPTAVAGTYTYSLVSVQESSGVNCSNSASGSATVVVNLLPSATIAGATTVCQNSPVPTITFTGSDGTAPYTFIYKINGGANQTVATISSNSITVSAPTGTLGSFVYSLVSAQESSTTLCSSAVNGSVTIVVNPLPSATIAGSTTVCQNSSAPSVTFTGNGATAPYTFTYKINGGTIQSVTTTSGNSVSISVPTGSAGTYTYTLVGVQESSGTSCSNTAGGSATIVVNPLPAASIAGTATICQNSSAPLVTFTGSGGTAPYSFIYKINGGANQTVTTVSGNSVTVNAPTGTAGSFVYSLVSVQESSATTCSKAAAGSATIVVNPLPSATIAGSTTVCQNGSSPSITFTGSGATAPYTFTYNLNGGANQTVTTTSGNSISIPVSTTFAGTYTYTLIGVKESSGQRCFNGANGNATVIVNPLPAATIAGNTTVCQNSSSPLIIFTGSNATAPYIFTYSINGGANQTVTTTIGNSAAVTAATNVPGTFTYSLISVQESSSTGCTNVASGSAIVVINAQPAAAVLLSPKTHLCNGDTGQLTIYNWTEGFTYTWYKDGVLVTSGSGQTMAVTQAGTYTVMVTSNVGCDAPALSNAVIITTGSISTPIITGYLKVCEGGRTKLLVLPGDKNKQYELYRWTDTPIGDTVAWDKSFSAYAGQYRVLVEREGCFDSTVVAVTSNDTEYPAGKLTVTAKDISYGGRVTMVAEVVGAAQYQWTLGNSQPVVTPSNTMSQNYYTRADSVVVKVKAISERNCLTDFSACIKIGKPDSLILVDHSWTGNLKDWNLFPVPFQNELKLSVILKRNESLRVDLFTGEGSWVRSWTFKGLKGENLFSLNNIDNLSSGVKYLITAIYNNEKHTDKIYKY